MNRRGFLSFLGVGSAAAATGVVAMKAVALPAPTATEVHISRPPGDFRTTTATVVWSGDHTHSFSFQSIGGGGGGCGSGRRGG